MMFEVEGDTDRVPVFLLTNLLGSESRVCRALGVDSLDDMDKAAGSVQNIHAWDQSTPLIRILR